MAGFSGLMVLATASAPTSTQPMALPVTNSGSMVAIIAGVSVAGLVIVFFAVKFWLMTTRPAAINDVATPTLDRRNLAELAHMAGESPEENEKEIEALQDEDAPADLKAVIPPDEAAKAEAEKMAKK